MFRQAHKTKNVYVQKILFHLDALVLQMLTDWWEVRTVMTHIRLTPVRSASITAHFGRLQRLSQRDRVRLVLFIHIFTIIVLRLVMLEIIHINKFQWKTIKCKRLKNALYQIWRLKHSLHLFWEKKSIVLKQKDEAVMCREIPEGWPQTGTFQMGRQSSHSGSAGESQRSCLEGSQASELYEPSAAPYRPSQTLPHLSQSGTQTHVVIILAP